MVARKQAASRGSRGGIQKRRTALRGDKDGDVSMDAASKAKGGITKRTPTGPADSTTRRTRPGTNKAARLKAEVMRHVKSGDVTTKGRNQGPQPLEEIVVTGWTDLLASSDEASLIPSIVSFVERKATLKSPTKRPVKIKKTQVQDEKLILTINAGDAGAVLRMDGWVFGKLKKVNLKFQRASKMEDTSQVKADTIAMMKSVLLRRYNVDMKLLDLSSLGQDPELKAASIFDSKSTTSKFFPALMKILDQQFKDSAEKNEAIQSVTLANNALPDLSVVTTLSQTLPQLRNLDLSNNSFAKLSDIENWRRRFSKLDHLVLTNNPIEQAEPNLVKTLMDWYPRLRMINSTQVRTDEEAARGMSAVNLPFPIKNPVFQDEGQIAETFIRNFFAGFDTDRTALARMYYDSESDFSFAVNTGAPRDPNATDQPATQEWEAWIKLSRNLKKLTHLPARQSRLFKGTDAIIDPWTHLPATRHPDLASEAKKWLIECQTQPGVPNPGQPASGGVDGFLITIHGEFDEMDVSTGQSKKKRSFDRTFVLGPGGPSGVRVVNDMLTVRAYGGTQAFEPEPLPTNGQPALDTGLPPGLTPEVANNLVIELQKQTGMTLEYAKDCLTQVAWDIGQALQAFESVKANLPPTAFVQAPVA